MSSPRVFCHFSDFALCSYRNSEKYGDKNVMNATYRHFYVMLKEGLPLHQLPEILITAPDFYEMKVASGATGEGRAQLEQYKKLLLANNWVPPRPVTPNLPKVKLYALYVAVHAYMNRLPLSPPLAKDVAFILQKSEVLLDVMLDMVAMKLMSPQQKVRVGCVVATERHPSR